MRSIKRSFRFFRKMILGLFSIILLATLIAAALLGNETTVPENEFAKKVVIRQYSMSFVCAATR